MLDKNRDQKHVDMDSRSNPLMTLRTVKYYCEKEGLFTTPQHNDKLYLQYKGFTRIIPETISQYHNLVALWLNNNSISKIEGLHPLINLTSLALNNNFISKMEGLENLINLSILNLSHNKIQQVEGLDQLRKLQTVNLSKNFIVHPHALTGLHFCQSLTSIDLSQNELENSEETFNQVVKNKHVSCLYLKATPLARGFRNYRKKLIAAMKKLKFLDDRPVLEKDHRLSEAWLQGGAELEQTQKVKMAEEKLRKQEEQSQHKAQLQRQQQSLKQRPESFIADIKETSIRIMNIDDNEEEQKIINKYFQNEKLQIEKNIKKKKEEEEKELARMQYYKSHETEVIAAKVRDILGQDKQDQDQKNRFEQRIKLKWREKYQKILETLLLRYKFDFSEVQPSFNMILATINKKLMRSPVRFQIPELRKIWTKIELRKRQEAKQ